MKEDHLYTVDNYFLNDAIKKADDSIWVACKEISPMILSEALLLLPEKRELRSLCITIMG